MNVQHQYKSVLGTAAAIAAAVMGEDGHSLMANLIWLVAAGALMRWSRRSDGMGTGSCHHRHGPGTGIRRRDRQCT